MKSKKFFLKTQQTINKQLRIPTCLRIEWWTACLLCSGCLFGCFLVLRHTWQPEYAWRWFWQAVVVFGYVLGTLHVYLPANHRKSEPVLLPTLGVGTWLTICRGGFISGLAGFLFLPWPGLIPEIRWLRWTPGVLYMLAAGCDYIDGYLARLTHHETKLGEAFDAKMDALGLLIAPVLAIHFGQLPLFYVAVGGAYYVFILGIWLRKLMKKTLVELPPRPSARMMAGFQMGFVGFALFPILAPPVTTIAAVIFMIPFLAGFIRDWFVVCGWITPDAPPWLQREQMIAVVLTKYLPLGLRLLILWAGWMTFRFGIGSSLSVWESLNVTACLLMGLGIAGRLAALGLSGSTGYVLLTYGLTGKLVLLFSCSLILLQTGTGLFSVWQPEDTLFLRRGGEKK